MSQNIAFDVIARDKASATFSNISRSSNKTEGHLKKFGKTAVLALGGVGVGAGLVSFLKDSTAEAREAQKAGALTTQVIKSTGGAAHVTGKQVGDLANSISKKIGVDDEAIQSGENLLLTFKNIRNESGKGNKIFNQATKAAVDLGAGMAAASGGQINFKTATTLVGKALNDPVKGLTALARVGVTFTKGQQDQIKKLTESGHRMKAQKIILKELKSEFGGAAASQATAADKAKVAWKNLEEQVGTALLPTIDKLAKLAANKVVPAISKFVTQMQDGTGKGGQLVDKLKDLVDVGKGVFKFFTGLPGPVKKYGAELVIGIAVMSKVTAGLRVMGGMFTLTSAQIASGMTRTQLAMGKLKTGLGTLAGAGGMVALMDGAKRADTSLGLLETTAGGAALGFSLGGPIGAGIGAGAGALFGLTQATKLSNQAFKDSLKFHKDYVDSLDAVTGKINEATRRTVSQNFTNDGTFSVSRLYGIPDRQVVNAATGSAKAFEAIRNRLTKAVRRGNLDPSFRSDFLNSLRVEHADLVKTGNDLAANTAIAADYGHKLDALPDKKQTRVEATGIIPTLKGVADVARMIHATPPEVSVLLSAVGIKPTKERIQQVIDKANAYGKLHPKPKIDADTAPAHKKLSALTLDIQNLMTGDFTALVGGTPAGHKKRHHRAMGGPVVAGQEYVVGERRPELFVPNQSGRIIPRVPTDGAAGMVTPGPQFSGITVYAQDVNDFLRQMQGRSRAVGIGGIPQ